MPSPEEAAAYEFTPIETQIATEAMSTHVIGDPATVVRRTYDITGSNARR